MGPGSTWERDNREYYLHTKLYTVTTTIASIPHRLLNSREVQQNVDCKYFIFR